MLGLSVMLLALGGVLAVSLRRGVRSDFDRAYERPYPRGTVSGRPPRRGCGRASTASAPRACVRDGDTVARARSWVTVS